MEIYAPQSLPPLSAAVEVAAYRIVLEAFTNVVNVVGEASNGEEAVAKTVELKPSVILMDLKMPGTNCIDAHAAFTNYSPI